MSWEQIAANTELLEKEQGTVLKDWGGRLPIALAFPNVYHLGMSSLALHTLYRLWNAFEDVVCERVFTDLQPPLTMESGAPLDYFPVLGFSISYEMDYFGVAALLRSGNIPPYAAERDESHPLVIAGGPAVSANPEPVAPFLDAVIIGEVEPILGGLTDALRLSADDRDAALDALAQVPGLYLPNQPSTAAPAEPLVQGKEEQPVVRQWLRDLDTFPTHSAILTPDTEFANMGLIEIARGCGRGCRFCLAGYAFRPPRQRSVESILSQARELLRFTDRLGLVSAAVSDHKEINQLAQELRAMGARISVSSMRVDPISEPLIQALAESGARTLTIAPEAGSERLRRVIHKTQSEDDVLRAVEVAARHGLRHLKLYFMVGLPTEDMDDIQALVDLALACAQRFPGRVTVNITPFVPKAHTPFERLAQAPAKIVKRRCTYVERGLWKHGVSVRSESPAWAEIQGTLARGDRSLASGILGVERLSPAHWKRELARIDLSVPELIGPRIDDESLPWDMIQTRVRQTGQSRGARKSAHTRPTPPGPTPDCGVYD